MNKKLLISAIVIVMLISSATLFAQTTSLGDTLLIGPENSAGEFQGALNEAIKADTAADGSRLHSVYRLMPNVHYILTEIIQGDFPLIIVADEPTETNRPPVIRCGLNTDGSAVDNWWHIYDDAHFENLWISGINLDGTGPISWISQTVNSENKTISYKNCIVEFPYTWWAMLADNGNNNTYKTENCLFMNIGNPTGATWNGAIFNGGTMDSVIHKNTTFYNFGCFATNGTTFYVEVDHCSFINSVVHPVESHSDVIKKYTNNIWVNCHAFSDDNDEVKRHFDQEVKGLMNYAEIQWDPQALDSLYGPGGVYGKDYDPNGDGTLTEGEQAWTLRNNAWFYTQPIEDYWAQFDQVIANPWMNNYNQAMFNNQDEAWTWTVWSFEFDTNDVAIDSSEVTKNHEPYAFFSEENTMNVDPGIVDMNGADVLLGANCFNIRAEQYGQTPGDAVAWHGVDNYLAFTWPLDIDLSYTNAALQTAGDGYPLGDLYRWFPEKYEEWKIGTAVEDENETSKPADFVLYENYPNPFNPTTTIKYDINTMGNVKLTIHNVLGEEVKTLVNGVQTVGSHSMQWDATNDFNQKVASGVYFYRLEQGNNVQIQKMMLVK